MFLGIEYDRWHQILAVVVILVVFLIGFFSLFLPWLPTLERYGLAGLALGFLYFGTVLFAVALQACYESWQAVDPDVVSKYGSFWNFQYNSRKDWKWFIMGVAIATVVIGIFVTVALYAL
jgi:hypothetical protein